MGETVESAHPDGHELDDPVEYPGDEDYPSDAPIAADRDQQRRGPPAERLVGQLPGDRVTWGTFTTTAATPLIGFEDPARQDRTVGFEALAGDDEAELVEAAEGGQVGVGERVRALADGSVGHVEVFRMGLA